MKQLKYSALIAVAGLVMAIFFVGAGLVLAGGIVTSSVVDYGNIRELTYSWAADADSGTLPGSYTHPALVDGLVCRIITIPGVATPPTDQYDVTLNDQYGVDVSGGLLANRSAVGVQDVVPVVNVDKGYGCVLVPGRLTMALAGSTALGATGQVKVLILK